MTRILLFFILLAISCSCAYLKKENERSLSSLTSTKSCTSLVQELLKERFSSLEKARIINDREGLIKGSFAEIGAGQEISGTFFKAQRASETIVKSLSAYSKEESNRLYGSGHRFVSQQRLEAMLDIEYKSLQELRPEFKEEVRLFTISNTVTTNTDGTGHGWIGIRYQPKANQDPKDVLVHLNFPKSTIKKQHEALGKVGVNLIHSTMSTTDQSSKKIIQSLTDNIDLKNIEVDFIEVTSNNRSAVVNTLELLSNKQAKNILLDEEQSLVPKDLFYKKSLKIGDHTGIPFSQSMNELEEIYIKKMSLDELTEAGHLTEKEVSEKIILLTEDGSKLWVTTATKYIDQLTFFDQGYQTEVLIKLDVQELQKFSSPELKSFVRSVNSLKSKFIFEITGDQSTLSLEAKKLIQRMENASLILN